MTEPFEISRKSEYTDGKYTVFSFTGKNGSFRRISCDQESICVVPFDQNEQGKVRNLYLARYKDHLTGSKDLTCITDTFDRDEYDSYFEAVETCVKNELGVEDIDINDVYFLGKVRHTLPFTKEYRCYAVDLTKAAKDQSGHKTPTVDLEASDRGLSIEKVRFTRVTNGNVTDSLVLSASLLLLSYLSE